MIIDPQELTPREGKCLRFLVSSDRTIEPDILVVNPWMPSDLPDNILQARSVLRKLAKLKLAERVGKNRFKAASAGAALIASANKAGLWNT
jgi:hypothetical protein